MTPIRRLVWAVPLLCVAAGTTRPRPGPVVDPDAAMKAALDRTLPEVLFNGNSFSDAVDFLRDASGVSVYVQFDELAKVHVDRHARVRYTATNVKLGKALADVLDAAAHGKGKLGIVGHVAVLNTPKDLARMRALVDRHRALKEPAALAAPLPELRFSDANLSDVIDFLGDATGVKFNPDWVALKTVGIEKDAPTSAKLLDVPLGDALVVLLDSAGGSAHPMDYRVDPDGSVTITTAQAVAMLGKK